MPSIPLPSDGSASSIAAELSITGLELIPAGVAAMVLTALGAALVITARRRRDAERETAASGDERVLPSGERVDV